MEIFERFGYMRSIFKCELSCGLELKGDYSLLTDDNQACIVFLPTCLSEYGGGGVPPYHGGGGGGGESGPLYGARLPHFSLFMWFTAHGCTAHIKQDRNNFTKVNLQIQH